MTAILLKKKEVYLKASLRLRTVPRLEANTPEEQRFDSRPWPPQEILLAPSLASQAAETCMGHRRLHSCDSGENLLFQNAFFLPHFRLPHLQFPLHWLRISGNKQQGPH